MSARQLYSTGSLFEPIIGCSRAVRTGDHLAISACAPLAPVFGRIQPACAFIQVVGFASPEWHLEIEADCHRSG